MQARHIIFIFFARCVKSHLRHLSSFWTACDICVTCLVFLSLSFSLPLPIRSVCLLLARVLSRASSSCIKRDTLRKSVEFIKAEIESEMTFVLNCFEWALVVHRMNERKNYCKNKRVTEVDRRVRDINLAIKRD